MKTTYEKFYRMYKLESLGEIIQQNLSEKEAVKSRSNKMKVVHHLTKEIYNIYPLIFIWNYLTIVHP